MQTTLFSWLHPRNNSRLYYTPLKDFAGLWEWNFVYQKLKYLFSRRGPGFLASSPAARVHWKQVDEFKYLGVLFGSDTGLHMAYEHLTRTMWGAWSLLQQRYRNLHCVPSVHLFTTLVSGVCPTCGVLRV